MSRARPLDHAPVGRADEVPSPCVNVCRMDETTGLCAGCLRTLDEIACWAGYTREEKLAVRAKLAARRRAAH
jgi:predicted Fe-S protein YdhL (DUF1289 family)